MIDVACFCGCCFSFDGGAAACPECGEVASVTTGRVVRVPGPSRPADEHATAADEIRYAVSRTS